MIAKLQVRKTELRESVEPCENLEFFAVTEKPFDAEGNSEDNSFSKWTPSAELKMTITNPNLIGKFKVGEKYYVNFEKVDS